MGHKRRIIGRLGVLISLGLAIVWATGVGCSGRRGPTEPEEEAGFRVVSSTPQNGATGVARSITVTITFSAPVDTSKLGFIAAPIPPGLDTSIVISSDLRTFSATAELEENTAYTVIFYTVQDVDGNPLEEPFVLTFTTGAAFPTATVSGVVRLIDGSDPRGSLVALANRNVLELLAAEDPVAALMQSLRAVTIVTDESGAYTIRNVVAGTYWVAGTKDLNGDGSLEPITVDAIGVYGGIFTPDSIQVAEGQAVSNINLDLLLPSP